MFFDIEEARAIVLERALVNKAVEVVDEIQHLPADSLGLSSLVDEFRHMVVAKAKATINPEKFPERKYHERGMVPSGDDISRWRQEQADRDTKLGPTPNRSWHRVTKQDKEKAESNMDDDQKRSSDEREAIHLYMRDNKYRPGSHGPQIGNIQAGQEGIGRPVGSEANTYASRTKKMGETASSQVDKKDLPVDALDAEIEKEVIDLKAGAGVKVPKKEPGKARIIRDEKPKPADEIDPNEDALELQAKYKGPKFDESETDPEKLADVEPHLLTDKQKEILAQHRLGGKSDVTQKKLDEAQRNRWEAAKQSVAELTPEQRKFALQQKLKHQKQKEEGTLPKHDPMAPRSILGKIGEAMTPTSDTASSGKQTERKYRHLNEE